VKLKYYLYSARINIMLAADWDSNPDLAL